MIKKLLLIISILININFLYCEDWTLGATQFTITESALTTEAEKTGLDVVATQIPSLILDTLPLNVNRTVFPEEKFERDLFKVKKERQDLFSSLNNQIKSRDTLMFSYSGLELKKKIENSENTIKNTLKKIEESEVKEADLIKDFNLSKKKKNTVEKVVLYQNDSTKLYSLEDSKSKEKINLSSIYGLITGTITPYGNYIKVESCLTLYPEGKVLACAKEVGLVSEVEFISSSILNQFLSFIINDELVQTDIFIYPQEAGENAIVYIEDYVLRGKSISTSFTPGEHSIRVESPGYETIYFSHNYVAKNNKTVSINMKKIEQVDSYFVIDSKKDETQFDLSSEIYLNSLYQGVSPISVLISEKTYLGEVVSKSNDEFSTFFVLKNGYNSTTLEKQNTKEDSQPVALQVTLPEAKEDLSKRIDKSRKRMYWSYGGLLLSLPLHYFAKGTYELCQENSSILDSSKIQTWKTVSDITMYTAIGAGVNFLVQLILYLVDADRIVPKTVEPKLIDSTDVEKLNLKIQNTRQKEEELKFQQELERQQKIEEEKMLAEEENNLSGQFGSKDSLEESSTDSLDKECETEVSETKVSENESSENSNKDKKVNNGKI